MVQFDEKQWEQNKAVLLGFANTIREHINDGGLFRDLKSYQEERTMYSIPHTERYALHKDVANSKEWFVVYFKPNNDPYPSFTSGGGSRGGAISFSQRTYTRAIFYTFIESKDGLTVYLMQTDHEYNPAGFIMYTPAFWEGYKHSSGNKIIDTEKLLQHYFKNNAIRDIDVIEKSGHLSSIAICQEGLEVGTCTRNAQHVMNTAFINGSIPIQGDTAGTNFNALQDELNHRLEDWAGRKPVAA